MRGISFLFLVTAAVLALCGMAFGINMASSGDHTLAPAHAHLNLLGWVGMAIFGFYYHLVPEQASGLLAKLHYAVTLVAVIIIVPGIVMAINEQGEALAAAGSLLSVLSMLIFLLVIVLGRGRAPLARA